MLFPQVSLEFLFKTYCTLLQISLVVSKDEKTFLDEKTAWGKKTYGKDDLFYSLTPLDTNALFGELKQQEVRRSFSVKAVTFIHSHVNCALL